MKKWWQLLVIFWLGVCFSVGFGKSLQAQAAPSQLVRQGQQLYQTGELEASLKLLQQANEAYISQKKYLQQAQIFALIAQVQQQVGNLQLAEKNITEAFASIATVKSSKRKTQVLAQTWNTKGDLKFARGNNHQALKDWQKGEKLYRQLNDRLGINGSLLDIAQVLEKMGFYDLSCDRTLEALESQNYDCTNLNLSQIEAVISQVRREAQPWQIKGLNQLSNILLLKGKLSDAEVIVEANRDISSSMVNLSPLTKAKTILNLGNINKAIAFRAKEIKDSSGFDSHSAKAIKYYQQLNQAHSNNALKYKLPAQLNLLSLFIKTQEWSKAQNVVSQIQLYSDTLPSKRNLYGEIKFALDLERLKNNKVEIKYSLPDIADIYLSTIEQGKKNSDLRIQSYALGYLGVLQNKQPFLKLESTPEENITEALNLALQTRSSQIVYRWQWQLGKVYAQGNYRAKAIALYQASLTTLASLREDIASLAKEVQFDFHEQIEPVYKEYVELLLTGESISDEDISLAMDAIESLQIAELDNYFQEACIISDKKTISQIDKNAAAIYTLIQPDRLEVIMAMNNPIDDASEILHHHRVEISQAELEKIVGQLRLYLTEPDRTLEVQKLSAQLYDLLIKPFDNDLKRQQPKNLVFILDGILQTIPMSVLYDGEKYLIEKYAIALTPGLKVLNLQDNAKEKSLLAGGVTKFLQVEEQSFSALENVETELNSLSQSKNKILLNKEFTIQNLLNQINFTSASHIHIATHAQFRSNPNQTFLLMWGELLNIKEFSDILQTRKNKVVAPIELLVLSACDTASGDRYSALGLGGVAVRSGASTTIGTLWQVNDKSTATLMQSFYRHLEENYTKAEALRLAQLELWEKLDQDWKVPAFWSGYITIGNWQ